MLHSRYYYSKLSKENQNIYRAIYDGWIAGGNKAELILPGKGFEAYRGLSLHNLVEYIILDNPHLFHLETSQFNYERFGRRVTISAEPIYSAQEFEAVYEKLLERVTGILSSPALQGSFLRKVTYLHDLLAEEIVYDRGSPSAKSQREIHTIVGALLNGTCVCDGYARSMRLLCDLAHISCAVVIGIGKTTEGGKEKTERHAWNVVKNQNSKYHIDTTWDSNLSGNGHISQFFLLRDDVTFGRDHVWDRKFYPKCELDYPREELCFKCRTDLDSIIEKAARTGKQTILFRDGGTNWPQEQVFCYLAEAINRAAADAHVRITYSYLKYDYQPYYQVFLNYRGDTNGS